MRIWTVLAAVSGLFLILAAAPALGGTDVAKPVPAAAPPLPPLDAGATLFRDVHVVTMTEAGTLKSHSVLVREGRIERVAPSVELAAPEGARVVEGGGAMWLIPGLCDLHIHFPPLTGEKGDASWRAATLLLANGVTTARGMIGHAQHIELRDRVLRGELLGPTLHVAGPPVVYQAAKTPEKAREMVAEQARAGFDFIKSHRVISTEVYDAVAQAAKEAGVPVTGHVDNEVGLAHALKTGQQVEHLDAYFAAILTEPELAEKFGQMPLPDFREKFDAAKIDEVAKQIAAAGVWSGATMALFRNIALAAEPAEKWDSRPELKYIMPQARKMWSQQRTGMGAGLFADAEFAKWFIDTRAAMLRAIHGAGGRLLACSDSPQAYLVTGFALHDELQAMADAGLKPADVLAAATRNAAEYFAGLPNKGSGRGVEPDFGVIAAGKRADLVVLRKDPTAEIGATREIEGVMLRGRMLDREELDGMLGEVEGSVQAAGV